MRPLNGVNIYAGTYTVTVFNTLSGCTSAASTYIIENAPKLIRIMAVD